MQRAVGPHRAACPACVPAPGGRYRVSLRPPIEPEGEGPEAEAALTRRYSGEIERDIRRRPELWLWMQLSRPYSRGRRSLCLAPACSLTR